MKSKTLAELPGLIRSGKVRDLYDLGRSLMIVTSDRISAFDVVMRELVPDKGIVLTRMSEFWLNTLSACAPHHLKYVVDHDHVPTEYQGALEQLRGRAMVAHKTDVLPIECVVRGHIIGGGWKEYRECGCVSGIALPQGLKLAERLPEPLFTPSTKADDGHDEPVSFEQACTIAETFAQTLGVDSERGTRWMHEARDRSLAIYAEGAAYARKRGIILADTKFEFGVRDGELLLIDEVLTPDSSRYWPIDAWHPGENPPSFDKQVLRDYLSTLDWDKNPPPPALPAEIIERTRSKYFEAFHLLTGKPLAL